MNAMWRKIKMTNFQKCCQWRCKNALATIRKQLKKGLTRLNRRNGKRLLEDAPNIRLNERDVI